MERKIGEIFEYNGEWYQCVESQDGSCKHCDMNFEGKCPIPIKECTEGGRSDKSYVIFKKLEKVGEPYIIGNKLIQRYKIYPTTYHINVYGWYYHNLDVKSWTIDIEIKQTKEDMEEKKIQHYDCFFDRKPSKSNLKPFSLELSKQGKPVCTRDGRKARIVCFDRNDLYPIVALIECEDGKEIIGAYSKEGQTEIYEIKGTDLMMLPEKKEGWVNVYKDSVYDTKDEALIGRSESRGYIDTIKVSWEE